jgi:RNA polymerase sigma factor (sigma-70 family)
MSPPYSRQERLESGSPQFTTTHWSVVLASRDDKSPAAQVALEQLCRTYWYPLYAHARRRGNDHHSAEDLTQEFFARLVDHEWLKSVGPEKGRFRTFLLTALDHFMANEWRRARTLRRGGGRQIISLEEACTREERFAEEPSCESASERAFDKLWATTVLEEALTQLQQEFLTRGKAAHFEDWKQFLSREASTKDCQASGERIGMSAGAVSVAVHRMRERYGDLLRETVAQTVSQPGDVDAELSYLFALLNE